MSNAAVKIKNLYKTMGKYEILHGISFEAYEGEVFGFLGPNGAGKTTTIKILTGLTSIDEGEVSVAGFDISKKFEKAMENIGAIVENPELYKHMTGRQNIMQFARIRKVSKERVDEVVKLVGLENWIDKKISKYSLGMRQRLGLAISIMHKPKVLILDEPTNGLDPQGIKLLRDILKNIAHNDGMCVIVSSHMMSEMENMCDRVGIITNGNMLGVYSIAELISRQNSSASYMYQVDNCNKAADILKNIENINFCKTDENGFDLEILSGEPKDVVADINKLLIENSVKLYTVSAKGSSKLEDVFISLTQNGEGTQIG